ncbi:hypothetical protein D3C76_1351400 [compost metagenome]
MLTNHYRLALQRRLTQTRLDKQPRSNKCGRFVVHQLSLCWVNQGDAFEFSEEKRMTIAHGLRHAYAGELPATKIALVGVLDNPLFIADQCTRTGGWCLGQLHSAILVRALDAQRALDKLDEHK